MGISNVDVDIPVVKVSKAFFHPQRGLVTNWHEKIGGDIKKLAWKDSPENDPRDALHRLKWGKPNGVGGEYKASWRVHTTTGTNGVAARLKVENISNHAVYVEFGRSASYKFQVFAWKSAPFIKMRHGQRPFKRPGWKWWLITAGSPNSLLEKTGARAGRHILKRSTQRVLSYWGIPF